jgi:hypothetical protein
MRRSTVLSIPPQLVFPGEGHCDRSRLILKNEILLKFDEFKLEVKLKRK